MLINHADVFGLDQPAGVLNDTQMISIFLGPIRLTSALIETIKSRRGVILFNTSVLGFIAFAGAAVYSVRRASRVQLPSW